MVSHGDQHLRLALAHRRDDVKTLNDTIRKMRKDCGDLDNGKRYKTAHGLKEFASGDRLLFTRNDRDLAVKNGMLGTVLKTDPTSLTIVLDDRDGSEKSRTVTLDIYNYDAVDHGYATTIHKSQGATVDKTFVLGSNTMDRHLTYVAMTRHRQDTRLYAGKDEFSTLQRLACSLSRTRYKQSTLDIRHESVSEHERMNDAQHVELKFSRE